MGEADVRGVGGISRTGYNEGKKASAGWHADITFEKVPSDYAVRVPATAHWQTRSSTEDRGMFFLFCV